MEHTPVTVLGLGAMGTALAAALLDAGHPTMVWNRSPDKAAALVARGATQAGTAAEAAAAGPLVILCVTDYTAGEAILDTVGDALSGRTLVNLATGTPDQARTVATWAAHHGAVYLDGVFQAMPAQIGTPAAAMLYAGSRGAFGDHRATLSRLGTATFVGDDAGQACLYDLALLGLWYETEIAYLHALALIGSVEDDLDPFVPYATRQLTYVIDALPELADEVRDGRYPRGPATLEEHARVLDQLVEVRHAHGTNTDQLTHIRTLTRRLIAQGRRAEGFTSLIDEVRTSPPARRAVAST